jgi:hypothetical protein
MHECLGRLGAWYLNCSHRPSIVQTCESGVWVRVGQHEYDTSMREQHKPKRLIALGNPKAW